MVAFLYLHYQDSQRSIELASIREISQQADTVNEDVQTLIWRFHLACENIQYDDQQFDHGHISNETRDVLFWRTIYDYFSNSFFDDAHTRIERDMDDLYDLLKEPGREIYSNISNTVKHAIDMVDFWDPLITRDYVHQLLVELYVVLGIDQMTQWQNLTALEGIAKSFSAMSSYWNDQTSMTSGKNTPEFSIMFDWALANATQLYQNLLAWHQSRLSQ